MADEKPSYMTSTLSQIMVLCILAYLTASLYGVWKAGATLDSMAGLKWLVDMLIIGYFVRGTNGAKPKEPA